MSSTPEKTAAARRGAVGRRLSTVSASLAFHALALWVVLNTHPQAPKSYELEPVDVALVDPAPMADPVKPLDPPRPEPVQPPPPRNIFRETPLPPPPDVRIEAAGDGPSAEGESELSDAEVASAATAGSGQPGGACNMPRLLQAALRRDALVQSAVASAHRGKAIMVWNGDWVRHGEQEGAGLAAVREAIMWEVAFAPEACRKEPVKGLILLSLNDGPGAARVVLGSARWRWTDMLFARQGAVADASATP